MIFQRIKSAGIAHNSYFIGVGSEAVVIDPRRDCQVYVDLAQQYGLKIKHILETHRNEDYVIGSIELNSITLRPNPPRPRAGLGASTLLRAGFAKVYNVLGSVKAWIAAGFPTTTD
jgi:glyoxylase-like metal-dependent hydrolase (beta-lactamase superfamily II)